MLLVLRRAIKTNFIPLVAYLHRSTNSEQPLSMVHDWSSLPPSSRVLIKNISQKCSRDDRKMTLGGLHGHAMVHSSGVGPPMVPRGHVIHHQQRCSAQQQVVPTISRLSSSGEIWKFDEEEEWCVTNGVAVLYTVQSTTTKIFLTFFVRSLCLPPPGKNVCLWSFTWCCLVRLFICLDLQVSPFLKSIIIQNTKNIKIFIITILLVWCWILKTSTTEWAAPNQNFHHQQVENLHQVQDSCLLKWKEIRIIVEERNRKNKSQGDGDFKI